MSIPFTLSPIASVISAMYQITKDINNGINNLIDDMKQSANVTISRTGKVLEGAKSGFAIGYVTPLAVIAVGQFILGNPLTAVVATASMTCSPIAMTCAAVGAIIYGWNALTPYEREDTLEQISKGLEVGIELIKSIIAFVIERTKAILSSENIEELKKYIGSVAATFGKSLSDVTHKVTDIVSDSYDSLKIKTGKAIDKTVDLASDVYQTSSKTAEKTANTVLETVDKTVDLASGAYQFGSKTAEKAANTVLESAGKIVDGIRERLDRSTSTNLTKNDNQAR